MRPQLVFVGDSITQQGFQEGGWLGRLAACFETKADVVNRGCSGYTTVLARSHQLSDVCELPTVPALVALCFGANDAAVPGSVQHVPLDEYGANLRHIVGSLRERWPGAALLLITPPPLDDPGWARKCADQGSSVSRTSAVTAAYQHRCVDVARDCAVPVVDLRTVAFGPDSYTDGLHLNSQVCGARDRVVVAAI